MVDEEAGPASGRQAEQEDAEHERDEDTLSPLETQPRRHANTLPPLETQSRRHADTLPPLETQPRRHANTLSPLEANRGRDADTLSPLETHRGRDADRLTPLEAQPTPTPQTQDWATAQADWAPAQGIRRSSTTPINRKRDSVSGRARGNTGLSQIRSPRSQAVQNLRSGSREPRMSISSGSAFPDLAQAGSRRRNTMGRVPSGMTASSHNRSVPAGFSLAGPSEMPKSQALPYVDPGYAELNPAYTQPTNVRPVWGLGKPLPRVIRPGMVPSASELNNNTDNAHAADTDIEKGRMKPTLQLDKVSSKIQAARQRREERVAEAYGGLQRHGTKVSAMEPIDEGSSASSTAENEEAVEDGDAGLVLPSVEEHGPGGSLEPFPDLENDDASQATTEIEDDEWIADTDALKPYGPEDEIHNFHTHWSVIRAQFREPLAELLAVTVQLTLGFCADLSSTTSGNANGNETTIGLSWGLASMLGVYIAGGISGAHLNPAISILLYVYRGFPLRKVPTYMAAQVLGAFIAALIAYGLYQNDIKHYGGHILSETGTANDFITNLRNPWVGAATGFFTEFTGTAILAIAVLALGDDENGPPGAGMNALIIGLVVSLLVFSFGYNTGFAGNPTRDLGPRFAVLVLGYGGEVFRNGWWVYGPWAGSISGAIFGGALYDIAIFVGGESPINYPRRRMVRAGSKWRGRWRVRIKRAKKGVRKSVGELKKQGSNA